MTNPGTVVPVSMYDMDRWGDYWRFTSLAVYKLLEEYFEKQSITVVQYGNYYGAKSLISGKCARQVSVKKLLKSDNLPPMFPIIIASVAVKEKMSTAEN